MAKVTSSIRSICPVLLFLSKNPVPRSPRSHQLQPPCFHMRVILPILP